MTTLSVEARTFATRAFQAMALGEEGIAQRALNDLTPDELHELQRVLLLLTSMAATTMRARA